MAQEPLANSLAEEAARLVREHGSVAAAARASGIPYNTFQSRARIARERGILDGSAVPPVGKRGTGTTEPVPATQKIERTETPNGVTVYSIHAKITTIDELIEAAKIDMDQFEVHTQTANQWQQGSKLSDGTIAVVDLWQIKATFRRRKDADVRMGLRRFMSSLEKARPLPKPAWANKRTKAASKPLLLELSVPDLHIGKLAWEEETGTAYKVSIATDLYLKAIDGLLERNAHHLDQVGMILLPTGNDLLHIDNPDNTTTAGTPQDHDGRWQKAFTEAHRMLERAIRRCREVAPVAIPIVPGNHDTTKMYCVGEVLHALYRGDKHVEVDNSPRMRKYVEHGVTLLGLVHGDKERKADLPLIMAREMPEAWARCQHHEWHLGHLHKAARHDYVAGDTFSGVIVRTLPSLSGTDGWHYRKGYVKGVRAAESYAWHRKDGLVTTSEWRVPA